MKCHIFPILVLIMTMESGCSADDGFLISAPGVFHVGVNKKVFVQMGKHHLNKVVTLYLEHETRGIIVSEKKTALCAREGEIQTVELMIDREKMTMLPENTKYLLLVAESPSFNARKATKVFVSKRRGNIFIQTDQPIYNPTQKVMYRIFTLDHTYRPQTRVFQLSVFNANGNRIMKSLKTSKGGIYKGSFPIPDVSKMGTWKIVAKYEDDEESTVSREFKVQKFVLPSFEVKAMTQNFILLNEEEFNFTIIAKYSHGEDVKGAYHCKFGVAANSEKEKTVFIRGLELTGSVINGTAAASVKMADIDFHLQKMNKTFLNLQQTGSQLYLAVFVTNIQSGEVQDDEVYLPIFTQKYTIDLSRTRSHFLPGFPLDVVVLVHLPDGSPAVALPVTVTVPSTRESWQGSTNQEGAVLPVFNFPSVNEITVEVSVSGVKKTKVIQRASSPTGRYLYLSYDNKIYSVGDTLSVVFTPTNTNQDGFIYYMVISRGTIITQGSLGIGVSVRENLQITSEMVPSFRLIGYYHDQGGNVIADSVWIDVKDTCEIDVKVEHNGKYNPGSRATLTFDLHGQKAKVALLAVDKAIYGLHSDNKLTGKQVFSSMQSYDRGCSFSGGSDPASVLTGTGLSFVSKSMSRWKRTLGCDSPSSRKARSVDFQQELMNLKSNLSEELQECCGHGFSLIPMRRTCEERAHRVSQQMKSNPLCADVFLKCCLAGESLRQQKIQEDAQNELGRTATTQDIEQFFLDSIAQYTRRIFPPSFAFREFEVNGKKRYEDFTLPDSITTWELQVVTLSETTGFCVVPPTEVRAFKDVFVSLRLPYSVRKYEQLSISPVIYNYGEKRLEVAVHMEQSKGLCSPGSATTTAYVNMTLKPHSSQFVSFSAVPMDSGPIPIKIRLYDINEMSGIDAIEKTLNVLTEGLEKTTEETLVFQLDGKSTKSFTLDGSFPDDTVPESTSNIFITAEGDGFGSSHAKNLLSPERVARLIRLPTGCVEQTMTKLAPTASALRYLDMSDQWFDLPAGARDDALDKIEYGYMRILTFKIKHSGSYPPFASVTPSNWLTALVVKVLSMVAERQIVSFGQQGRKATVVPEEEIRHPVRFLLSAQERDGSFSETQRMLHQGVLNKKDQRASMTAFIALALHRSLQFLSTAEKNKTEAGIARATSYVLSQFEELQHPYAVAVAAYSLSVCRPDGVDHSPTWGKLESLAAEGANSCYLWPANPEEAKADGITIQTTAYALLTAVELGQTEWADKAACWLTSQENYNGGFLSSQDTILTLEALAEYELKRSASPPEANLMAEFKVSGKRDILKLAIETKKDKVETDLKKLAGNNILVELAGKGDIKLKVLKAYHLLEPKDDCRQVSISVTVEGKVKYTAKVIENYDYYDDSDDNGNKEETHARAARSLTELFDARTRYRRELDNNINTDGIVKYTVCVSGSQSRNLTGMSIADITLLSGFEAETEDLESLKGPEQYISHYEVTYGRVVMYFNEIIGSEHCISFHAVQRVAIGLLQPAPAVFYDYYEPNVKCTVFYSAPQRSKLISKLCTGDVCQCAERPCHKLQNTFLSRRGREDERLNHACFFPTIDYAYIVEIASVTMKSNFELYKVIVKDVLRSNGDELVEENSVRVFAKRSQCKGQLDMGKQYLIMGKDGATTDSDGMMQYLLESNTWVERKPLETDCKSQAHKIAYRRFTTFVEDYKIDGCRQ